MSPRSLTGPACALALVLLAPGCRRGDTEKPGAHHYSDKDAALARFEEPERDAWAQPGEVIDALALTTSMDLADIGAGSGYFTRRLAHAAPGGTTYAVDVDADFKDHIEAKLDDWRTPNIETRLAVYEHPLLPEDSVDLVFISNTYSFLQDRVAYFSAVHKALRPGGRLAVIDWRTDADCPRVTGCPKPKQRVPKAVALDELETVGFVVLSEHDFLRYQYFVILGKAEDQNKAPAEPAEPPESSSDYEPTPEPGPGTMPADEAEEGAADEAPEG